MKGEKLITQQNKTQLKKEFKLLKKSTPKKLNDTSSRIQVYFC